MNQELDRFARGYLLSGLKQCTPGEQKMFKLMYASGENNEQKLKCDIVDVVNAMQPEKLDWAMQQIQRTLANPSRGAE